MKEIKIPVPSGIQYLSEWEELDNLLPHGQHFILDKHVTGCGATEKYLRDDSFVIIAMPRKHLLYNKLQQHSIDKVFLYRFIDQKQYFSDKKPTEQQLRQFDHDLSDYLLQDGKKILTTYDSLAKILNIMKFVGIKTNKFKVIVDEVQQIFGDAPFKANIEHQFYLALRQFDEVIYLSATPFLSEYLDMSDQFKGLPLIRLVWDNSVINKSHIYVKKLTRSHSIAVTCREIIERYKSGNSPTVIVDGQQKRSKEAVFFLNDVGAIIDIIRKSGLKADEINILCAPRRENIKRLQSLSKKMNDNYEIGTIPGRGETNKMFTFCTSTVYIGSDFYSDSAYTYIFANPNVQSLCLDVATDLQQILGRQRSASNPFRNTADLYYYLSRPITSESENEEMIKQKREETKRQIENFKSAPHPDSMLNTISAYIEKSNHRDQYCCISEGSNGNKTIVENSLIWIAERRAWDIANKIYSGDFSLFEALKLRSDVTQEIDTNDMEVQKMFNEWSQDNQFKRKAMLYCDTIENCPELLEKCSFIPGNFHEYYDALGRKGMEALSWRPDYIKSALAPTPVDEMPHAEIASMLMSELEVGKEYTVDHVKSVMKKIYAALSIKGKPKSTNCSRYITVKMFSKWINKKKTAMIRVLSFHRQEITIFDRITDVNHPRMLNINEVLDYIKTGSYPNIANKVAAVRGAKDKDTLDMLKLRLPAVIWNGAFRHKHKSGCEIYSSYTALDFDHLTAEDMTELKSRLEADPCVYAYFVTPSGQGLKAIILHDNYNPENHLDLYIRLLDKFNSAKPDKSTQDLARGNYLSYDPDLWINPNPVPFHYEPSSETKDEIVPTQTIIKNDKGEIVSVNDGSWISRFLSELNRVCKTDEKIISYFRSQWTGKSIEERGRNLSVFSYAGVLCKAGVELEKTISFIREMTPDLPESELLRTVNQAYSLNIFGCERRYYLKSKRR